jgi:small basic protein
MGPLDLAFHLLSFVMPALALAVLVALAARVLPARAARRRAWWVPVAVNAVVGCAVLAAGLWYFGRDGKMATYAALVLAVATSQWLVSRGLAGR